MIENPIPWPDGARCAVAFTFDMDADSILHLAHHASADTRVAAMSMLRYGPLVAMPRILKMYRRHGLRQTFFIPSWCLERYPDVAEVVLADGHEIGYHGYLHERPNELEPDRERYWLERGIDAFVHATGKRPRGIRVPSFRFSRHTLGLLIEEGFAYDTSLMGDDVPYLLRQEGKATVTELPILDYDMDDWPHFIYSNEFNYKVSIKSPEDGVKVYREEFDAAWKHGGLWIAVLHPFLSGRLARMDAFDRLIEYMQVKGGVWFAALEDIADHVDHCVNNGSWTPRVDRLPYYDGPIPELGEAEPALAS